LRPSVSEPVPTIPRQYKKTISRSSSLPFILDHDGIKQKRVDLLVLVRYVIFFPMNTYHEQYWIRNNHRSWTTDKHNNKLCRPFLLSNDFMADTKRLVGPVGTTEWFRWYNFCGCDRIGTSAICCPERFSFCGPKRRTKQCTEANQAVHRAMPLRICLL
jgi:hypothetical protein